MEFTKRRALPSTARGSTGVIDTDSSHARGHQTIIGCSLPLPFAHELVPPAALFPISSCSLWFQPTCLIFPPETPFSMEVDLDLSSSALHPIKFEAVPHLQTPAHTPAVPIPALTSPNSPHPTWFNPSSNVTQASA